MPAEISPHQQRRGQEDIRNVHVIENVSFHVIDLATGKLCDTVGVI